MLSKKAFKDANLSTLKRDYLRYVETMKANRKKSVTFDTYVSNQYKSYTIEEEIKDVESMFDEDDEF